MVLHHVASSFATLLFANFTAVLCVIAVLIYLVACSGRPRNFPPGPRGFPILGVAPYAVARFEKSIMRWRTKYGDLMGFNVGSVRTVVLNNYDLIHDALVKKANVFSGRPAGFVFTHAMRKTGLVAPDYTHTYVKERKFAAASLSKLGFGKTHLENTIMDEGRHFISQLPDSDTEFDDTAQAFGNVICQVLFGRRYEYEDPAFQEICGGVDKFFEGALAFQVIQMLPWSRYIPPIRGRAHALVTGFSTLHRIVDENRMEHARTLDPDNPRDFIDDFLLEQKEKGDVAKNMYTDEMLMGMGRDFFAGGMETGHNTLIFLMILVANRPEIQKKMHDEIESAIGSEGIPKYALRESMPYCLAVIKEAMRYRTVLPLSIPRYTEENIVLRGYDIPKGTLVLTNIYAVHNDPKIWENPEAFRPERFLDEDGKVLYSKYLIPFGIGARACMGRRLAEVELFVFTTTILQKFRIVPTPTPECERPHVSDDPQQSGLTMGFPKDARIALVHR